VTIKDRLLSAGVSAALRRKFGEFASVLRVDIDSREKRLRLETLPEGEIDTIVVEILGYALVAENGGQALAFDSITASRPWMTKALEFIIKDKKLPLPAGVPTGLLKTVL
jgi:hypothetical protein